LAFPRSLCVGVEEFGDVSFEPVEDREGQGHICNDSEAPGADALVESHEAVGFDDLLATVDKSVVFVGVEALQLGLDDVNGVVSHGRAEPSKTTGKHIGEHFRRQKFKQVLVSLVENDEADTLV